jgi:precorrin-3B synthase
MTGNDDMRKGWCPGARRPMQAKDGLIVRLKISGGIIAAATMRAIAQASRTHGNGIFDLTSRASLQMRGVQAECLPHLIEALDQLGLIDATAAAEAVRNVLVSPLSGLDGRGEASAAAKALEAMLADNEDLHSLPAKFGFLIDDASFFSLAAIPADVRFDWLGGSEPFAIGIGGCASEAIFLGRCRASAIPAAALRLARAFLHLAPQFSEPPRRMRGLIARCGADAIAALCGLRAGPPQGSTASEEPCPVGLLRLNARRCFGAGAAFGHLDADMLDGAARATEIFGNGEIRLTPWRALILPLVREEQTGALRAHLARDGFIVEAEDPRLAVSACRGALTCDRGTADTRSDALALMFSARKLCKARVALHISGCSKGCAQQAATPLTLTAHGGLYDLAADEAALGSSILPGEHLTLADVRQRLETAALSMAHERELATQ